jgi:hypothetical protein
VEVEREEERANAVDTLDSLESDVLSLGELHDVLKGRNR